MTVRFGVPMLLLVFVFLFNSVAVVQAADIALWDVGSKTETSLAQAVGTFPSTGIVYVGELHDNAAHHAAQLAVIQSIDNRKRLLAVGLEMFQHLDQNVLDTWVAQKLSENDMRRAFARNWGQNWDLYRDIFVYCRDRRIPMIGLNVPRSITRKVARSGFEALTEEEIGKLPPIVCRVDREYEAFLRRVLGSHSSDSGFRRFCEAQIVWDTALAIYSLAFLEDHPGYTVVVLSGMIHTWKKAAPEQASRQKAGVRQVVIQPSVKGRWTPGNVSTEDADYLILGLEE